MILKEYSNGSSFLLFMCDWKEISCGTLSVDSGYYIQLFGG